MRIPSGGIDIFYLDESMDRDFFAMSSIAIPFVRSVDNTWTVVWEDQFNNIRDWRKLARQNLSIPVKKELKGSKLLAGRGGYKMGGHQFSRSEAAAAFRFLLSHLTFLQNMSIITVVGNRQSQLYGHTRLEALLFAMLQRMRKACDVNQRLGMVFFDEGHGEYRKLYRKARVFLPTGSDSGAWSNGNSSINLPLDNFFKDANIKDSKHSLFIQLADIVSYAAFIKIKGESNTLTPWQASLGSQRLYDNIPTVALNTRASRRDAQGIVRL